MSLPDVISQTGRSLATAVGLSIVAGMMPAAAAAPDDADWPCIQPLVPELTASQMWAGPPSESAESTSSADRAMAELAHQLASRSTPVEEAEAAIDRFASGLAPEERTPELTGLFRATLQLINQERGEIIAGIERYTRKQQRLADRIAQESQKLANVQPGTTPDPETQQVLDARQWDLRVFQDRQRLLTQICEQPVLLEQRAFSLSRAIQSRLEPK